MRYEQERECRAHRAYADRCKGGTIRSKATLTSYCFSRYVLETPDGQRDDGFPFFSSLRRGAALPSRAIASSAFTDVPALFHSSASWEAPEVLHLFVYINCRCILGGNWLAGQ